MGNANPSNACPQYVEVAVPVPLTRTFTYRVPDSVRERKGSLRGKRVRVPFGGRILTGCVVGPAEPPADRKVLDILSVLDDGLVATDEVLRLTRWMADYYCAGWGEALKAALPAGAGRPTEKSGRERVCTVGALPPQEEVSRVLRRSPRQRELLGLVLDAAGGGGHPESGGAGVSLRSLPPSLRGGPFKALVQRGWIRVQEVEAEGPAEGGTPRAPQAPAGDPPALMEDQRAALNAVVGALDAGGYRAFLLQGVTGSGKTEVYLRAMERALALGRGALVLVPEIALTPQLLQRFRSRFGGRVAELHSGLAPSERRRQWRRAAEGPASIVVGARSAVFAPVRRLGLVVVDEEHDASYKQEESPRYNARDAALVRARQAGACAILGSATPSLESFYNGEAGKYVRLCLPKRVEDRPLPRVSVVDLRSRPRRLAGPPGTAGGGVLSEALAEAISSRLGRGEQTLLFLNRRGFAACLQCRDCGWTAECPHCSVSLTFHLPDRSLRCHYCDHRARSPEVCPACSGSGLDTKGVGTQRVEDAVRARFSGARIARMDRDTTRSRGAHGRILDAVSRGEVDVLVGTQMVAKGHDYPGITLVGVILADATLNMPDFRSAEKTFQVLTQVSGRAGRGGAPGEVIIQTYRPEHYAVRYAASHDYEGFVREELRFRRELHYPPYSRMARFRIEAASAAAAERFARRLVLDLAKLVKRERGGDFVEVLGPAPGVFGRLQGRFRWQVVLKSVSVRRLGEIIGKVYPAAGGDLRPPSGVRLAVDVDPVELF
ncbi:MAG: primosomal protein N' [Candidatus Tectomicrobia bacterium]|nr:primosomal protein N' [Candidatus Tectomicrobia bacterium]